MQLWKRGDVWYVIHTDPAGKRRQLSTGERDKRRAEIAARRLLRESTRFIDYSAEFFTDRCPHGTRLRIEGRPYGATHQAKCLAYLRNALWSDPIARVPIESIRRRDVLDLRMRLAQDHPPNTANKILETFKVVLSEATYREDITHNPAQGVGTIRYERERPAVYDAPQLVAYAKAAPPALRLVAMTGVRIGEMAALRSSDIDGGVVTIQRAVTNWSRMTLGPPKWHKVRAFPLPAVVGTTFGKLLAFPSPTGVVLGYSWLKRHHDATIAAAGLPRITRHALRASLHTVLASQGVNALLLSQWFGWARDLPRVQSGYFRPSTEQLRPVADAIDRLYKGLSDA